MQIVNSDESLQRFMGDLRSQYQVHRYLRISIKTGKARTLPQNDITHVWYGQIARELPEDDALGWRCYCKLHHGVPIMRAEDAEFQCMYDSIIKGRTYEEKLLMMKYLPVTSLMSRKQLSTYAEAVQADFRARGVFLVFPGSES
ncbi:hypothetical protein MTR80_06215 [Alcaligenes aquatilis]|uniref:Uncharacterized protein n=1 Tax=Alcaligenes aquatilis TaxID=323284 RepID=A0ABY4NKY5_9BURK|nr:hypothetical protein [Alcaligenes aquatilis]UQN37296.1 hypothetical protein MTR80_06215 [Alcaligenes aquatilis]